VEVMMPLLRDWDFDALITHNRFTLANRNAEEMLDLAHAKGIAVLNAAPYAGGILAKGSSDYPRYLYQEDASDACEGGRITDPGFEYWPQTEAAVGFLNAFQLSGDAKYSQGRPASLAFYRAKPLRPRKRRMVLAHQCGRSA
jgi:aryl-alcohol dehydrogenase-like predicted oxidoreductase